MYMETDLLTTNRFCFTAAGIYLAAQETQQQNVENSQGGMFFNEHGSLAATILTTGTLVLFTTLSSTPYMFICLPEPLG